MIIAVKPAHRARLALAISILRVVSPVLQCLQLNQPARALGRVAHARGRRIPHSHTAARPVQPELRAEQTFMAGMSGLFAIQMALRASRCITEPRGRTQRISRKMALLRPRTVVWGPACMSLGSTRQTGLRRPANATEGTPPSLSALSPTDEPSLSSQTTPPGSPRALMHAGLTVPRALPTQSGVSPVRRKWRW